MGVKLACRPAKLLGFGHVYMPHYRIQSSLRGCVLVCSTTHLSRTNSYTTEKKEQIPCTPVNTTFFYLVYFFFLSACCSVSRKNKTRGGGGSVDAKIRVLIKIHSCKG